MLMGKKLPILTKEEQDEKKLEYYQTMSVFTGKSISELRGDEKYKDNYPNNDCKSKELILKNCAEPITSRELWDLIQRQGYAGKYKTFTSLLVRYHKAGFIEKSNNKPVEYQLSEFGIQNAKSPKMLREKCIRRYHEFQNQKLANIINNDPVKFKEIYESIVSSIGGSVCSVGSSVSVGNQYSSNDFGSEELKQELNSKIFDNEFFKNADEGKLKTLVDGILKGSLTTEEREELLIDALQEAVNSHKGSMVLNRESKSSKPDGERKYYKILVKSIDKPVTKFLYKEIPFVFIFVSSKNELRLESESIAGRYRNNKDAIFIDFDLVNQRFFHNNMQIKTKNNGKELEFYYAVVDGKGTWGFNRKITTMSFSDYQKALNKSRKQTVKIKG
ncbi:hypothetical protein EO92_07740 [Methanosarcina sp. 2.H.A.1B.4]|nr:hypothetical protein EO92_07740 [Methanosarcina sp. 2.H.A.1B.4]